VADDIVLSSSGITSRRGLPVNFQTPPAVISGGTASGGVFRGHTIQFPWNYTQSTDPIDASVGTATFVDGQVTLTGPGGFPGPQFQSTHFGPRAVFQNEVTVLYGADQIVANVGPVSFGDFPTHANTTGVGPRLLVPGWGFLSARSVLADGATARLTENDYHGGGAAFVDSGVWGSINGGTLDGLTHEYEAISVLSKVGFVGNTSVKRRIGFDVGGAYLGWHPTINPDGTEHWSGLGGFDDTTASTVQIDEEIGLRITGFELGDSKIGVQVWPTSFTNSSDDVPIGIQIGTGATITVDDSASFRTGANFLGIQVSPTVVYESDGGVLASYSGFSSAPILKNAATEAHTVPLVTSLGLRPTFRGDGAALTASAYTGFNDAPQADVINAGSVSLTAVTGVQLDLAVGASTTAVTRRGLLVADATGSGAVTTQVAVDIAALAKATTNIGIRNASTYVATPPATQTLAAAGNAIVANAEFKHLDNSTGGSLTLTSAPTIADGQNGQTIELMNVDSADNIVLQDQGTLANSNLRLQATTITLTPRDSVRLRYSATVGDWVQVGPVSAVL
jgi:hypothetical protein